MLRNAWFGGVLVLVAGCSESAEKTMSTAVSEQAPAAVTQTAFNIEGAPTVEFSVPDMVCEFSCVPEVRKSLASQPGVKDVKVELATHTATVAIDKDKFDADKAIAALVDLQFKNTKLASPATAAAADQDAKASADAQPKS